MYKKEDNKAIRLLVMDVDGTLTDGRLHISDKGEIFKDFYVRDGYAIKHLLPKAGISSIIITGRKSKIVSYRARELGIQYAYQNVSDKGSVLRDIVEKMNLEWNEIACIGDDVNDLPMMRLCGLSACPGDSVPEVKKSCDYVCTAYGGRGAVREFIGWILDHQKSG